MAAIDRYIALCATIAAKAQELADLAGDHFEESPDSIDYSHVGSAAKVLDLLDQATAVARGI